MGKLLEFPGQGPGPGRRAPVGATLAPGPRVLRHDEGRLQARLRAAGAARRAGKAPDRLAAALAWSRERYPGIRP